MNVKKVIKTLGLHHIFQLLCQFKMQNVRQLKGKK